MDELKQKAAEAANPKCKKCNGRGYTSIHTCTDGQKRLMICKCARYAFHLVTRKGKPWKKRWGAREPLRRI